MRKEDARQEILRVYRHEYLKLEDGVNATESTMGALPFYTWLQSNRPDLLNFRQSGDKYQVISGWVVS